MNGDKYYLDTSALLPYYREEPASEQIQKMLDRVRPPVLISDLTRVEMASAIARWARMKEIDESQAALIENSFYHDISQGLYLIRPLAQIHFQQAEKWLSARKTALRTMDALHVACCWGIQAALITCDHIMHESAVALGLESTCISQDGSVL
jgi:predicted nucleic acid-binding protein